MRLNMEEKEKVKKAKIIHSFKYAIDGCIYSFKKERNMKVHILIMLIVILMGIILKITWTEWIICIMLFAIVISGELFNTAIEIIVDMVRPYKDENAKNAKDIAAGGVLVLAIGSIITGLIIFVPKIIDFINIY